MVNTRSLQGFAKELVSATRHTILEERPRGVNYAIGSYIMFYLEYEKFYNTVKNIK